MKQIFLFDNKTDKGVVGIELAAMEGVAGEGSVAKDATIAERLKKVADKAMHSTVYGDLKSRLHNKAEVTFFDLVNLPDGVFFDCGLTRATIRKYTDAVEDEVSAMHVDANTPVSAEALCMYCQGDEAVFWQDDQNNAFIDSRGEMSVMAHDKLIRFKVRNCPMCGRRFPTT